jgi:hypothetical protein
LPRDDETHCRSRRSKFIADLHDQVSIALRFVNRALSCLYHELDLTLVDRHSLPSGEKVAMVTDAMIVAALLFWAGSTLLLDAWWPRWERPDLAERLVRF